MHEGCLIWLNDWQHPFNERSILRVTHARTQLVEHRFPSSGLRGKSARHRDRHRELRKDSEKEAPAQRSAIQIKIATIEKLRKDEDSVSERSPSLLPSRPFSFVRSSLALLLFTSAVSAVGVEGGRKTTTSRHVQVRQQRLQRV